MTPEISALISIGLVQMLAVISPGPSFLITARTAVAKSRFDGFKVGLGIGAGTVAGLLPRCLGLMFCSMQFRCFFSA